MKKVMFPHARLHRLHAASCLLVLLALCSCSTGGTTSPSATSATTNAYAAAYQKMTWAAGVTVTFPSACSMTVAASGLPYQHQAYYLGPANNGQTVVATTPSGIQLAVVPYASAISTSVKPVSATFNICPVKASGTTTTSGGAIGLIGSGTVLFNAYEATQTVALGDNASYTFTQGGVTYTASFLDPCNQHTAQGPNANAATWHFHGNPTCWTANVDSTGASHIIGIALDGFPIYGGRDAAGKVVDSSTLDACNGISSATPEFPAGAYHYVLPIDANGNALTTKQSSLGCYAGTVNAMLSAQMQRLGCRMPMLLAGGRMRLPDGRNVSKAEAVAWMDANMPGMGMDSRGRASDLRAALVTPFRTLP